MFYDLGPKLATARNDRIEHPHPMPEFGPFV
jgi:hypothetical protein